MGWADDMYAAGYTPEHGGLMVESWSDRSSYHVREKLEKKPNSKANNSGKPWKNNDLYEVLTSFNGGETIESIAIDFGRTPYAIAWQLFNMDKISDNEKEKFK
jgi:hypothetical protein